MVKYIELEVGDRDYLLMELEEDHRSVGCDFKESIFYMSGEEIKHILLPEEMHYRKNYCGKLIEEKWKTLREVAKNHEWKVPHEKTAIFLSLKKKVKTDFKPAKKSKKMKELIDKYTGGRAISSSALKDAKKSTRDFLHYYKKEKTTATHFDFGNALELYIIDKEEFNKKVAIMDESKRPFPDKNYQTKVNKEWKDQFYIDNASKYIIATTGDDSFETITTLEALAKKHPAYDMLIGCNYQDAFEWTCPRTGLPRYARTDLFSASEKRIIDIKTDGRDDFERACTNNDYFLQAFDQIQGAIASGKMEEVEEYYWFVFTKKAPYFIDVYKFDLETAFKVEESYWYTLERLVRELQDSPEDIVWHEFPVDRIKVPNYYK